MCAALTVDWPTEVVRRMVLACFVLSTAVAAHAETALRSINVKQDGDAFIVDAVIFAPVPPALAWEVLTDFDRMNTFIPNLRMSRVLKRDGNQLAIEQQGVAKFGLLSFPYVSERNIDMSPPNSIRSVETRGNMKRFESVATFSPEGSGTLIGYRSEMVPSPFVAKVLSKNFLEHEVEERFNAIVGEMVRRRN
jgi:hypothetical protein